jgi:hypothetical protein
MQGAVDLEPQELVSIVMVVGIGDEDFCPSYVILARAFLVRRDTEMMELCGHAILLLQHAVAGTESLTVPLACLPRQCAWVQGISIGLFLQILLRVG